MELSELTLEHFRSFHKKTRLILEPGTTTLLGANDHGKSNLLEALRFLDQKHEFDKTDLSWTCEDENFGQFPRLCFRLKLNENDREAVLLSENDTRSSRRMFSADGDPVLKVKKSLDDGSTITVFQVEDTLEEIDEETVQKRAVFSDEFPELALKDIPTTVTLIRTPDEIALEYEGGPLDEMEFLGVLEEMSPLPLLFRPRPNLDDSLEPSGISGEDVNHFMRGILFTAGIDPDESEDLFAQTDRTQMVLDQASQRLNENLRSTWSQGRDLRWSLRHNSEAGAIDLRIHDPAVETRFVRASQRSGGFTHFFTLRMMLKSQLYSRGENSRPLLLLFDEPGIFLHPAGQADLLSTLDQFAAEGAQIVLTTHSVFMISRPEPHRHRLVVKDVAGSHVDTKPERNRWAPAFSSLGIGFGSAALFADRILLVEGDSDPWLLYALLAAHRRTYCADYDLNSLAIVSTGNSQDAAALFRMLTDGGVNPPLIANLFDGDAGGKAREKSLKKKLAAQNPICLRLPDEKATEDLLPTKVALLSEAIIAYAKRMEPALAKVLDPLPETEEVECQLSELMRERSAVGLGEHAALLAAGLLGLEKPVSKVGLAREVASILRDPKRTWPKGELRPLNSLIKQLSKHGLLPNAPKHDQVLVDAP